MRRLSWTPAHLYYERPCPNPTAPPGFVSTPSGMPSRIRPSPAGRRQNRHRRQASTARSRSRELRKLGALLGQRTRTVHTARRGLRPTARLAVALLLRTCRSAAIMRLVRAALQLHNRRHRQSLETALDTPRIVWHTANWPSNSDLDRAGLTSIPHRSTRAPAIRWALGTSLWYLYSTHHLVDEPLRLLLFLHRALRKCLNSLVFYGSARQPMTRAWTSLCKMSKVEEVVVGSVGLSFRFTGDRAGSPRAVAGGGMRVHDKNPQCAMLVP
jgi:hypothetical protein